MGQSLRIEQICLSWIRWPACRKQVTNPPTHFLGSDFLPVHLLLSLTMKSVTVSSAFFEWKEGRSLDSGLHGNSILSTQTEDLVALDSGPFSSPDTDVHTLSCSSRRSISSQEPTPCLFPGLCASSLPASWGCFLQYCWAELSLISDTSASVQEMDATDPTGKILILLC